MRGRGSSAPSGERGRSVLLVSTERVCWVGFRERWWIGADWGGGVVYVVAGWLIRDWWMGRWLGHVCVGRRGGDWPDVIGCV